MTRVTTSSGKDIDSTSLKVFFRFGNHGETHIGVLITAKLGTLAAIFTGLIGLQDKSMSPTRDQVESAGQGCGSHPSE